MRTLQAQHVAGKLDHGDLEAQADAWHAGHARATAPFRMSPRTAPAFRRNQRDAPRYGLRLVRA